jgi:hypothetical protein
VTKRTEQDPLFKKIAKQLGRMGYTANSLAATPDGYQPKTLQAMMADILEEIDSIWRLIGYTEQDWDDQIATACVDASAGLDHEWKPYE